MKGKAIDYTGSIIGNLTVLSLAKREKGRSYWNFLCDCGFEFVGEINNLKNRILNHDQRFCNNCRHEFLLKHGDARKENGKARLYRIWQGMRYRCDKEYASHYEVYGGRGIKVCPEWCDYLVFKKWALENGYADNLSIDRIDSDGDYSPHNCRWVNKKWQANNTRQIIKILYKGKHYTIEELSELTGLSRDVLRNRHWKGWPVDRIIAPHRTKRKKCESKL